MKIQHELKGQEREDEEDNEDAEGEFKLTKAGKDFRRCRMRFKFVKRR